MPEGSMRRDARREYRLLWVPDAMIRTKDWARRATMRLNGFLATGAWCARNTQRAGVGWYPTKPVP